MNKKVILFSHYFVDDIVIRNFNNVKNLNPSWDIYPIGFKNYNLLPDSLIADKEKYPKNHNIICYDKDVDWFDPDFFIYDGYFQKPNYDEYFLYEYDTVSNVSIEEFFDTNVDFFGNGIRTPYPENDLWAILYRKNNTYNNIFTELNSYGQSTCIYFKNDILRKTFKEITENGHLYDSLLSELRGGTIVSKFTNLKKGKPDIERYISWSSCEIVINFSIPHFHHPIKT